MDSTIILNLGFAGIERRLVEKLAAVESRRAVMAEDERELAGGKFGEQAIGEAANKNGQTGGLRDGNLLQGRPEATAAGELDHEIVDQTFGSVVKEVRRADAGFVDGQRQGTLLAQATCELQLIRREGLLQNIHARLGKAARRHQRFVRLKALVGVGPDKSLRPGGLADSSGQGDIGLRSHGDLEVKVTKALLLGLVNLAEDGLC